MPVPTCRQYSAEGSEYNMSLLVSCNDTHPADPPWPLGNANIEQHAAGSLYAPGWSIGPS